MFVPHFSVRLILEINLFTKQGNMDLKSSVCNQKRFQVKNGFFWLHCVQYHIAGLLAKRRCLTLPEELPIIYLWLFEGIEHVAELAVLESKHAFRLVRAVSLVRFSGRNQDERAKIIHECER
jgi:hypothetical protein